MTPTGTHVSFTRFGVSDGNTITPRYGEPGAYELVRVRVAGIDAPEKSQGF